MATLDLRYSFTEPFLEGAAIFASRAHVIESDTISEELEAEHRACVVSAVVQSALAFEAAITEAIMYKLGFDEKLQAELDEKECLVRYEFVLNHRNKPELSRGANPYQHTKTLVRLRNEIVHYKSRWQSQNEKKGLPHQLKQLAFVSPEFVHNKNIFPYSFLSASLASWAVLTAKSFIEGFYIRLEMPSPLAPFEERLKVPPPKKSVKPLKKRPRKLVPLPGLSSALKS
jgi:hypothetical protein